MEDSPGFLSSIAVIEAQNLPEISEYRALRPFRPPMAGCCLGATRFLEPFVGMVFANTTLI
ncbi:hypothetical protein QVG61_03610 [Thiohalobacter sp. IOR34]|uniref:hypothetical protein n=1 Tax=Thiohalobacter sp. IOR34 TaxID=3057176 RepID=UPI0025B14C9F|nr:hypothetical protein [Thiohalobacter sp. IOR34]WJW76191.1 hypothetical protein QVG61_03610 [Thiohalobacter sp. IOR34]